MERRRDGKALENLVARIERYLSPDGFTVRVGQKIFEDGEQLAEFDVVIEGRIGTSDIKWLIECRDRPSGGKAPVSWLQQLIGRRVQFNFDRVLAVSTTGFSNGAERLAAQQNISLRTVTTIEDIANDFSVGEFNFCSDSIVEVEAFEARPSEEHETEYLDLVNPTFRVVGDPEFQTLHTFVFRNLTLRRGRQLMELPPKEGTFSIRFGFRGKFEINTGDRILDAVIIQAQLRIQRIAYPNRGLTCQQYDEKGRPIGQVGEFEVNLPTGTYRYTVYWLKKANGQEEIVIEGLNHPSLKLESLILLGEFKHKSEL